MEAEIDNKSQEFAKRLQWALGRLGIVQPTEQVQKVASAGGVTPQTARKYLSGKSSPKYLDRYDALSNELDVFVGWLMYGGDAPRTMQELEFVQKLRRMTNEERNIFHRITFLLKNGSKRTQRLLDLANAGQISHETFLEMIGGRKV